MSLIKKLGIANINQYVSMLCWMLYDCTILCHVLYAILVRRADGGSISD